MTRLIQEPFVYLKKSATRCVSYAECDAKDSEEATGLKVRIQMQTGKRHKL